MEIKTQLEKINNLIKAIDALEGVPISYPVIKENIHPLQKYLKELKEELKEGEH